MNIMELAAEHAMRLKAIHIGSILAREAATSGAVGHQGHALPIWTDPSFPPFPDALGPLSRDQETIKTWLETHEARPLTRARVRRLNPSQSFPILTPLGKTAPEREGATERRIAYITELRAHRAVSGGPPRLWMDKIID